MINISIKDILIGGTVGNKCIMPKLVIIAIHPN